MAQAVNQFTEGVDRDSSPHDVPRTKARSMLNMRLETRDGQTMAVVNLKGNTNAFQLTSGFLPLGHATYGSVTYIFSFNQITGEGEVGTFPSPKLAGTGGWDQVYRPLQNWNGAIDPGVTVSRLPFRTTLFTFDCGHQLEVEARVDFDTSVNLYIADGLNVLRRINTGFDSETGAYTSRLLWTGSWLAEASVFFETCNVPVRGDVRITSGGSLLAGNYFVYPLLATENLDETSYYGAVGPIQVGADLISTGATTDGAAGSTDTQKAIEIDFTGLDPAYSYLRVAIVRYFDNTFETYALINYYPINNLTGAITIRIDGSETRIDKAIGDILRRKAEESVAKSLAQVDNRLWGANWSTPNMPYDDMKALAALIQVAPQAVGTLQSLPDWTNYGGEPDSVPFQYKDYHETLDGVGYFRAEPYAFAIVFVMTSGVRSKPYPVKGYDAWYDPTNTTPNIKGILRMPSNMNSGYQMFSGVPKSLGVQFDTASVTPPAWFAQVCGFFFVRGERKPDLLYQGFATNTWNFRDQSLGDTLFTCADMSGFDSTCTDPDISGASTYIAEIGSRLLGLGGPALQVPMILHYDPLIGGSTNSINYYPAKARTNRWGVFSTDHFFLKEFSSGDYSMVVQGRLSFLETQMSTSRRPCSMFEEQNFVPAALGTIGMGHCVNVIERTPQDIDGFTSMYYSGDEAGYPYLYDLKDNGTGWGKLDLYSSRMFQRNYIGVRFDAAGNVPVTIGETSGDIGPALVNIYRGDPVPPSAGGAYDLLNKYDLASTEYFPISDFIPIADWATAATQVFYHGDCFLQRTYHRHVNEGGYHSFDDGEPGSSFYYAYGNLVGCVQECAINTAMRYESGYSNTDQRYYPEKQISDPARFAAELTGTDESRLLNRGYDKTLGIQGALGDDPVVPYHGTSYKTRIKYTETYLPGGFTDGYTQWPADGFRDYNHKYGPITRIGILDGKLFSVQEQAISLHYTNEQAMVTPDGGQGQLVLGNGDVLSEKAQTLTEDFGSQHQWSLIRGGLGWYGWDQNKRLAWRLTANGLDRLSDRKAFSRDATDLSEFLSDQGNVAFRYPDAPICQGGITAYNNSKFNEIGWSILIYNDLDGVPLVEPFMGTIGYDEKLDRYVHARTHHSPYYISLNRDLFAVDPLSTPPLNNTIGATPFWRMDSSVNHCEFFGVANQCGIGWTTAPSKIHTLVFDTLYLSSNDISPLSMEVRTQFQSYLLTPFFSTDEWKQAQYQENQWTASLLRATSVFGSGGQDYLIGSKMRGRYIQTTFTWSTTNEVVVDGATTKFRFSRK